MSLLPVTYECDWPRCTNNVTVDWALYSLEDYGWEGRLYSNEQPKLHVCPCHARQSLKQLLEAWLSEETRTDSIAFGKRITHA